MAITHNGMNTVIPFWTAQTATQADPTLITQGIDIESLVPGPGIIPLTCSLVVVSTAGSGTMDVTCKLWGLNDVIGLWCPMGVGSDHTTVGIINDGDAIGECTISNKIRHAEPLDLVGHFNRLYLQITAINGTSTAVSAYLIVQNDRYRSAGAYNQ